KQRQNVEEHKMLRFCEFSAWGYGFLAVSIINLSSLMGLALVPFAAKPCFPKVLSYFTALGIGTLFSNAVLQLIPEVLGFDPGADNYNLSVTGIFGGFYVLFFTEGILKMVLKTEHEVRHHPHTSMTHSSDLPQYVCPVNLVFSVQITGRTRTVCCGWLRSRPLGSVRTVAWMVTLSDALHNFADGLVIGASFVASVLAGFSTSIAVMCEELPHELGDFVILLNAGLSIPQAVFFNILSSLSCYLGLALGILVGGAFAPNAIFGIAGGMFLYVSAVDMVGHCFPPPHPPLLYCGPKMRRTYLRSAAARSSWQMRPLLCSAACAGRLILPKETFSSAP
uniref:Solute carrier family 39 member 8 n=1 Tax=Scleropages formosus TaxID=113540 RepID=A0A8C9T6X8_SCLFO